jgi:hypothetical protein
MALKHSSALLLAAFVSLTSALSYAAHPHELAPGNWPTFNNEVNAVLPLPDGSFIVGGEFQSVTIPVGTVAQSRSKLVRILSNGTIDLTFPTADSRVRALAVDSAGRIFIGGDFDNLYIGNTPVPRKKVARLTSTFAIDTVFDTATSGPTGSVLALAPTGDGSVYIGGQFNTVGGVTSAAVKRMAKLKTNGTLDTSFTSGADNDVHTILRLSNGTMYVGGITNYWPAILPGKFPLPGAHLGRLIKVSASGSRDAAFKPFPPTDFSSIVYSVIQLADGSLLVGANTGVKRFNAATGATIPYSLTGHSLAFGAVGAVAQQVDGKLLSGAYGTCFLTDLAGTKDDNFNVSSNFSQQIINTIKLDKNGRIFIGGNFTYNDGVNTRSKFVVLNGTDPRSQTITFPVVTNPTFKAPNNVFTLNATSTSGLKVAYAVTSGNATLIDNKLTILGAGTIVVTATQAGDDDFDPATPNALNIFVPLETQTISFAPLIDRPTGSAPFLLSASTDSGLTVSYDVIAGPANVDGNLLTLTGVPGTVTVRAEQEGSVDYLAAAPVEQTFEVFAGVAAPLPQTIIFNALPPRFANESAFGISATATSGLPVTLTVTSGANIASIAGSTVTLSGQAGNVTITATQAGNINFLAAKDVPQSFKVNAAAMTLTLTDLLQTYDGMPKDVGVVGGMADSVFYTINKVKGTTAPTAAGSYPVEAVSGTGAAAIKKAGTLVVNKAPLLVVADDKRKFIGQLNPALTFAYSGFLGSDHAGNAFTKAPTVTTKATTTSPGGNYPITAAGGASNNYNLVYVNGNLKVESWAGQYEAIVTDPVSNLPTAKVEFTVAAGSRDLTGKLTTSKQAAAVPFKGQLGLDFGSEYGHFEIPAVVGNVVYQIEGDIPLNAEFSVTVTRQEGGRQRLLWAPSPQAKSFSSTVASHR